MWTATPFEHKPGLTEDELYENFNREGIFGHWASNIITKKYFWYIKLALTMAIFYEMEYSLAQGLDHIHL